MRTFSAGARWLRDRLAAAGLPGALAASALVLVVGVTLLVLVLWMLGLLAKSGPVAAADRPLYDWVVSHRVGWATTVLNQITGIGSYTATALVSAVAAIGLALYRREALPLLLLVTVPLERYLQQGVASLVRAPRPPAALAIGPAGTFPSGGSARVVLVGGMVAWLLARRSRGRRTAVAGWTVVALAAFVEGWSRLYLGRHWIADVLGGWLFGALLLLVLLAAASLLPLPSGQRLRSPRRGLAGSGGGEAHDRC